MRDSKLSPLDNQMFPSQYISGHKVEVQTVSESLLIIIEMFSLLITYFRSI